MNSITEDLRDTLATHDRLADVPGMTSAELATMLPRWKRRSIEMGIQHMRRWDLVVMMPGKKPKRWRLASLV